MKEKELASFFDAYFHAGLSSTCHDKEEGCKARRKVPIAALIANYDRSA